MYRYSFVHISDIHFGQEKHGTLPQHQDVRDELLRHCSQFFEHAPATGILINGDTAFSGQKSQYDSAGTWLESLCNAVRCDNLNVWVIPGNHDVDREKIDLFAEMTHERIRRGTIEELDEYLEKAASVDPNPLLAKLEEYFLFARRYNLSTSESRSQFWRRDFPLGGERKLSLLGFNSVLVCDGNDDKGNMVLGRDQYTIPNENNTAYAVMVHHPMDWFKDVASAKTYLNNRVQILMTGHEHINEILLEDFGNDKKRLIIRAGATNPPENQSLYNFRYNIIEVGLVSPERANYLEVSTHEFVWNVSRTRFEADGEPKKFEIFCPLFSPTLANDAEQPQPVIHQCVGIAHTQNEDVVSLSADISRLGKEAGDIMVNPKPDDFSRLRYYFWKDLSWQQRLQVLVAVQVLPTTTTQPMPQRLETMALEKAKAMNKLGPLWDQIMACLPDEKRQPNPFDSNSQN
jgi:hypothetical protein